MSNIVNEGEDRLDLDTGYFTRKAFLVDNEACELYEETVTKLIKDTKKEENGRVWYLTTITLPAGILFPDGTPEDYSWIVAPIVDVDDFEKSKYPIPEQPGKFYQTRVGLEDANKFDDFKEALVYLGMQ
tara:strand:- start:1072 stop:1458 length:387 start_codon:yes stop_codon:yes gene_type:complete